MHFTDEQQLMFDKIIGKAALAHQEQRYDDAMAALDQARALLEEHNITDDYDWSGWYDLKMTVEADQGNAAGAARTAIAMLDNINPEPPEFSSYHQSIIQESLVEACLVYTRYALQQPESDRDHNALRRVLTQGAQWADSLGRDEDAGQLGTTYSEMFGEPLADDDGE